MEFRDWPIDMADPSAPDRALPSLQRARVTSPIAPMLAEPRIESPQISQQLAGHVVEIVAQQDGWVRARGVDQYLGWMSIGFLEHEPTDSADEDGPSADVSLGCKTENSAGSQRWLPLRARLRADERVIEGEAIDALARADRFPLSGSEVADTARRVFLPGRAISGGGVTPWGADCSGMVQVVYALHGYQLPRDSGRQAELGTTVGDSPLESGRAGDLWFFSDREDRRITHVGVADGTPDT